MNKDYPDQDTSQAAQRVAQALDGSSLMSIYEQPHIPNFGPEHWKDCYQRDLITIAEAYIRQNDHPQRPHFEKWAKDRRLSLVRIEDWSSQYGDYICDDTQLAWEAWKEANKKA